MRGEQLVWAMDGASTGVTLSRLDSRNDPMLKGGMTGIPDARDGRPCRYPLTGKSS